jgi:Ca2+-binding EF-hand superfamily protein
MSQSRFKSEVTEVRDSRGEGGQTIYTYISRYISCIMAEKTEEWTEKTQARIREAFELFDKDKADAIMIEEVTVHP